MARRKLTAAMLDGTEHEAVGEFMALADRVAFERRFGVSTAVLSKDRALFDEGGELKEGVDPSGLREEYHAFLTWRVLARAGCPVGDFESFLENVAAINVGPPDGGVDPTE